MDGKVIHESIVLSLEGKIAFPAVVQRLIAVGTERYYADLVRLEKVFYSKSGETHIERLPLPMAPEIAGEFEAGGVQEALRRIQRGEIHYPDFLRQIMSHGCAAYGVYIDGRQAVYFGRKGEAYVERFPQPK